MCVSAALRIAEDISASGIGSESGSGSSALADAHAMQTPSSARGCAHCSQVPLHPGHLMAPSATMPPHSAQRWGSSAAASLLSTSRRAGEGVFELALRAALRLDRTLPRDAGSLGDCGGRCLGPLHHECKVNSPDMKAVQPTGTAMNNISLPPLAFSLLALASWVLSPPISHLTRGTSFDFGPPPQMTKFPSVLLAIKVDQLEKTASTPAASCEATALESPPVLLPPHVTTLPEIFFAAKAQQVAKTTSTSAVNSDATLLE
mmetsp:Transcript_106343/g.195219  ORF Transcript_106343/g.195219 Transcript_106343/m.195219 type:complete len:261 (-) Transcript_106343:282-1064(-)